MGASSWQAPDWTCAVADNGPVPTIADPTQVDEIDVVAVAFDKDRDWSRWTTVPGDTVGTVGGDLVAKVLGLVEALPESEPMRCFVPGYAVRLRRGPRTVAEVAFCFDCHNAKGLPSDLSPQTPTWFTFDPDSEPAQELLRLFRYFADRPA
jgi:hypothetical protein